MANEPPNKAPRLSESGRRSQAEHRQRQAAALRDNLSRRKIDVELEVQSLTPIRPLGERLRAWREVTGREIGFTARLDSHLPIRIDPEEHDDWGWFSFAEAYEKIRWTDDREALEQLEASLVAEARTA